MATMTGAIAAALIVGRVLAPTERIGVVGPATGIPEPTGGAAAPAVRWLVDVGERRTAPELAAHAPVALGDRVVIAGSRVGYVALDRATGAVAWRRFAGPSLSAPLVIDPHDVVTVRDCEVPIAAPPGQAVIACFERIDPLDIAGRSAGSITAPIDHADPCAGGGVWRLERAGGGFHLQRGRCALAFAIPDGVAEPVDVLPPRGIALPAGDPDCDRLLDGTGWCQLVDEGVSRVVLGGFAPPLPGLSLLAFAGDLARGAAVVRRDATLRHDEVVAWLDGRIVWTWPLPEPVEDRATPVGVAITADTVYVHFDTSRVAALVAPGAR